MIPRSLLYKVFTVFILLFIIAVLWSMQQSRRDYTDIVFLDVGQGDGSLMDIHNKNSNPIRVMIDTGKNRQVTSSIDKFYSHNIINYLSSTIISNDIDTLILTHNDSDHIGMRCEIINRYNVKNIIISDSMSTSSLLACDTDNYIKNKLMAQNKIENKLINKTYADINNIEKDFITLNYVHTGDTISVGNINLKVLNPNNNNTQKPKSKSNLDNRNSIVVLLEAYNNKILFTGDIDKKVEMEIVNADLNSTPTPSPSRMGRGIRNIDILKVAHHGSDGSSGDIFIKYIKPKVSVISVGKNNYGHPSSRVIDDLTSASSTIHRTDQEGNVMFHFE